MRDTRFRGRHPLAWRQASVGLSCEKTGKGVDGAERTRAVALIELPLGLGYESTTAGWPNYPPRSRQAEIESALRERDIRWRATRFSCPHVPTLAPHRLPDTIAESREADSWICKTSIGIPRSNSLDIDNATRSPAHT
jgi:hypothetical protein